MTGDMIEGYIAKIDMALRDTEGRVDTFGYLREGVAILRSIRNALERMQAYSDITKDKGAIATLGCIDLDHFVGDIEMNIAKLHMVQGEILAELQRVEYVSRLRASKRQQ